MPDFRNHVCTVAEETPCCFATPLTDDPLAIKSARPSGIGKGFRLRRSFSDILRLLMIR
jgi:hypothetical protein